MQRIRSLGSVAFLLLGLAACATPPPAGDPDAVAAYKEANDPLEPLNRYIFEVNRGIDMIALRPAAEVYRGVLPEGVRDSVRNFLDNLKTPVTLANQILQGDGEGARNTVGRFMANTFIGVGGLFDVVPNVPKRQEDMGQTLAVWGASEGPYLVLPLIGPSPVRDTAGMVGDYFLDPVNFYARRENREWITYSRAIVDGIDLRSRNIETLDEIERTSIDFYAAVRSLYRQRRNDEIRNGEAKASISEPEISEHFEEDDSQELRPTVAES
jgi:phospholipid-binding lipoprotein MlaA